jgi:hypothetical protein
MESLKLIYEMCSKAVTPMTILLLLMLFRVFYGCAGYLQGSEDVHQDYEFQIYRYTWERLDRTQDYEVWEIQNKLVNDNRVTNPRFRPSPSGRTLRLYKDK